MAEEKARDPTKPEIKPVKIPLAKIHDLPGSVFAPPSPKSLEALTSSIVLKGVQEPVILRQREDGDFQIVSGNRRRKASELAKQTEIPAFVYDMTEREAKEFRFRNKGEGTPPGKLLSESEIGKKRDAPEKAPDKASDAKKPDVPLKSPEKPAGVKTVPALEPKEPEEKPKTAAPTEKVDADGKAPVTQPKPPEKAAEVKPAPVPDQKKPEEKPKVTAPAEKADADGKKPDVPQKPPEKPIEDKPASAPKPKKPEEKPKVTAPAEKADADGKKPDVPQKPPEKPIEDKPTSAPAPKKPEEKPKATAPAEKADADGRKPDVPTKPPEKPTEVKPAPAFMPGPAALGPTGTKITKIFEDRLLPPDENAMKDLPVPNDGESYFITLHPAYLEKSEFNTVSVDVTSDDYKELKKSIELNGVKDPVLTRINPKGGLEVLSGQRRHMIARELNYPVPAIIQKIDDNDAMILVADANLHRPHISTYDLSRTLRNKMNAMKRKAGRKKRGAPGADELQSDAVLAKEMGISISKLNRIVRLSEATKDVCDAVDDHSIELSIAAEISFLKPHNQDEVIHLAGIGYINNRIVVLDLYEMGEQLRPTALVVALEAIQNRVMENRKRGKYTWVFLDEVYLYFKYKYSGEILYRAWKRFRKYGAALTAASQNVEECLKSETARLMFANSEFLLLFNQAATDRAELSKLLHISDTQLSYITNAEAGHGLLRMGGAIVPFTNTIPRDTELYKLMTTTPGENLT